jgi:hypothetical protein
MRNYRLYPIFLFKLLAVVLPAAMFLCFLAFLALLLFKGGSEHYTFLIFTLFMLVVLSLTLVSTLRIPHLIEWHDDNTISFVSRLRTTKLKPENIVSIKPDQFGTLKLKHTKGKIELRNHFDDFHNFIVRLKAANSSVEVRGC